MKIEFDTAKNAKNIRERGIDLALAANFDLANAKIWVDTRKDYGEKRFIALGYIDDRLFSMVFTMRTEILRVISLRKANKREENIYAKSI